MPCASISISCLSQDFSCPSKVSFKVSKAVFNASVCSFALVAPLIQPHRALTPFPRRLSKAPRATIIPPISVEAIAVLRIFQAPPKATVAAVLANCAVVIAFNSVTVNLFCFELSIIVANLPFKPLWFNSVAAVLATVAVVASCIRERILAIVSPVLSKSAFTSRSCLCTSSQVRIKPSCTCSLRSSQSSLCIKSLKEDISSSNASLFEIRRLV